MSGNYQDLLNQGLQVGRLTGELAESQGKAATAGIRAVDNEMKARAAKKALEKEQEVIKMLKQELAEQKALVAEFTLSTDAFKKIARNYGKKLNLSDEQRLATLDDTVIEIAEEKPEFKNTKLYKAVLEAQAKNK
jgi:uncharacterized protein YeaO (DUF488 family)